MIGLDHNPAGISTDPAQGPELTRHRGCLEEPAPEPEETADAQDSPDLRQAAAAAAARRAEDSALAVRTRQRYEQVQALRAAGKGIKPIAREAGLAKETVRRSSTRIQHAVRK